MWVRVKRDIEFWLIYLIQLIKKHSIFGVVWCWCNYVCPVLLISWIIFMCPTQAVMFQPIEGLESVGLSAEIMIDRKTDTPVNPFSSSLLVVCEGRAFPVQNAEDRRSVLSLIPKPRQPEPIYWKNPGQVTSPLPSCMSSKSDGWSKDHKGIKYMAVRKEVTFDDELHSPRYTLPQYFFNNWVLRFLFNLALWT